MLTINQRNIMVFETRQECIAWLKKVDLNEENAKIIAIIELTELYSDINQAIEVLEKYSKLSKKSWQQIYNKNCMIY
jgi:inorganic pyrophosphatase